MYALRGGAKINFSNRGGAERLICMYAWGAVKNVRAQQERGMKI